MRIMYNKQSFFYFMWIWFLILKTKTLQDHVNDQKQTIQVCLNHIFAFSYLSRSVNLN